MSLEKMALIALIALFVVLMVLLVLGMCKAAKEADEQSERIFRSLSEGVDDLHAEASVSIARPARKGLRISNSGT